MSTQMLVTTATAIAYHLASRAAPTLVTASLAARLPNGSASALVHAVLHEEAIPYATGLVNIPLVSLIAIASGGSAGPEGPVLPVGGCIGGLFWHLERSVSERCSESQPFALFRRLSLGDLALVGGCASIAAFFERGFADEPRFLVVHGEPEPRHSRRGVGVELVAPRAVALLTAQRVDRVVAAVA